jgi:translation initiation factor eIF-2B subunit epsilon
MAMHSADSTEKRLEILGEDSEAHFWPQEEEEQSDDSDSDDEDDPYENPGNKRLLQLGRSLSNYAARAGSTDSLSTLSKASTSAPSSPQSYASDDSMESDTGMETSLHGMTALSLGPGSSAAFRAEAAGTLQRAWDEGHAVKNLEVEFGLLVPAFNAGVDAAREEVLRFFLSHIDTSTGVPERLASARKVFITWGPIIGKYATTDRSTLAFDMQRYCCTPQPSTSTSALAPYFGILLRAAYETDLLEETPLIKWRDTDRAQMAAKGQVDMDGKKVDAVQWEEVWKRGKVYVDVLESMESDSEEEESEEGSEEEESGEESD